MLIIRVKWLSPTFFDPKRMSSQALTSICRARFIVWRLRHLFLNEMSMEPKVFLEQRCASRLVPFVWIPRYIVALWDSRKIPKKSHSLVITLIVQNDYAICLGMTVVLRIVTIFCLSYFLFNVWILVGMKYFCFLSCFLFLHYMNTWRLQYIYIYIYIYMCVYRGVFDINFVYGWRHTSFDTEQHPGELNVLIFNFFIRKKKRIRKNK